MTRHFENNDDLEFYVSFNIKSYQGYERLIMKGLCIKVPYSLVMRGTEPQNLSGMLITWPSGCFDLHHKNGTS